MRKNFLLVNSIVLLNFFIKSLNDRAVSLLIKFAADTTLERTAIMLEKLNYIQNRPVNFGGWNR